MGVQSYRSALTFFRLHFPLAFLVSLSFSVLGHHLKPPPHNVRTCVHVHTSVTQVTFTGCWRCLVWEHRGVTLKSGFFIGLLASLLSFRLFLTGCQTREVSRTYNLSLARGQYIVLSPPGATTILQGSSDWTMLGKALNGIFLILEYSFPGNEALPTIIHREIGL